MLVVVACKREGRSNRNASEHKLRPQTRHHHRDHPNTTFLIADLHRISRSSSMTRFSDRASDTVRAHCSPRQLGKSSINSGTINLGSQQQSTQNTPQVGISVENPSEEHSPFLNKRFILVVCCLLRVFVVRTGLCKGAFNIADFR